jgi:hypothetical protein
MWDLGPGLDLGLYNPDRVYSALLTQKVLLVFVLSFSKNLYASLLLKHSSNCWTISLSMEEMSENRRICFSVYFMPFFDVHTAEDRKVGLKFIEGARYMQKLFSLSLRSITDPLRQRSKYRR